MSRAAGLPAAQLRLLTIVRRKPGVTMSACATRLGLEVSTTSNIVKELSGARLLRVTRDPLDRRRKLLFPLPAAARYQRRGRTSAARLEPLRGLLCGLTEQELRALNRGLAAVVARIPESVTGPAQAKRVVALRRR